MRKLVILLGLLLVVAVPALAWAALPRPTQVEIVELPNDDGTGLGVLWYWDGDFPVGATVTIECEIAGEMIDEYSLSAENLERLLAAREWLREHVGPILPDMYAANATLDAAKTELQFAVANREATARQLRLTMWQRQNEFSALQRQRDKLWEKFSSRVMAGRTNLFEQQIDAQFTSAMLNAGLWAATNAAELDQDKLNVKGEFANRFGHDPPEADKLCTEVNSYTVLNPQVINGTYTGEPDEIDYEPAKQRSLPFKANTTYNLRMVVNYNGESAVYGLPSGAPKINYFNSSLLNNLIFAVGFAIVILVAIMIARRNPNIFIRRISGLEAVDEAIGRATEMGKPVLYICGLDSLASLSTLAAINILGRVARRIADYDSDLIVPHRDPIVLTVAQEVVREAYIDQGRPDAYKEDNIFFATDDQFSFTATTCAIMMRDKPAANFFMGYYYAESLLLAETGASTGAIQIAGTDALHQLPFFITTCDYTLIGEELYAASAYLSREPMLLGSLKGQDVGKALIMLLIVIQTLLFAIHAIMVKLNPAYAQTSWDWLKVLVEALGR
jgi:hypothetical protein